MKIFQVFNMDNLREASVDLPELRARLLELLPSLRSRLSEDPVELISFYCTPSFAVVVVVVAGCVISLCCLLYIRRLVLYET